MKKVISIKKHGIYDFELGNFSSNLIYIFVVKTDKNVKINISGKVDKNASLKVYFVPHVEDFDIESKINMVVFNDGNLSIAADALLKNSENVDSTIYSDLKELHKGRVVVSKNILVFDNPVVKAVPEFSILPGGIEQIHGMVIYGLETMQRFFLRNRGISNLKKLFV